MTEIITGEVAESDNYHDYHNRVHDYFFSQPGSEVERAYYEDRGLTFTNNLHLWFVDEAQREVIPGFANPYDYRSQPFGEIIEDFRVNHQDLWLAVQRTSQEKKMDMDAYTKLLLQKDITPEILEEYEQSQRDYSAGLRERVAIAKSQAFDIIAPQLADAGIDPLDVCR